MKPPNYAGFNNYAVGALSAGLEYMRKRRYSKAVPRGSKRRRLSTRKRTRNRKRVRTTRTREGRRPAGEWDYTKRNVQFGRKPRSTLRQAYKLLKSGISKIQYVNYDYTNQFGANGGTYLSNRQTALGAELLCPMYMWDMTSVLQRQGTTNFVPNVRWRVVLGNETITPGSLTWRAEGAISQLVSQTSPGDPLSQVNYVGERGILDWINAKFLFYAPTVIPIRIQVDLVQFRDDNLMPTDNSSGTYPVNQSTTDARVIAFYQYLLKKFMWTPLESGDQMHRKSIRYLKRMTLYMDPKESTDGTATRYKELNFFANLNRMCDYRWDARDLMAMTTDDTQFASNLQNRITVEPKKRVWLILRATSSYQTAAVDTNAHHPSFDYYIKSDYKSFD